MSSDSLRVRNRLEYRQVDVFTEEALGGNGLAVFVLDHPLKDELMQELTRELRQFESIFLAASSRANEFTARVFTMEGEVPFAGHPAIGAAAVLHERSGGDSREWQLALPAGSVALRSKRCGNNYFVTMDQGQPTFGQTIAPPDEVVWLDAFGLNQSHRDPRLPICVVSTGLPYLIVPLTGEGVRQARIVIDDLVMRLANIDAAFAYVFDLDGLEGRTWDNLGRVEDIATGSAAGPVGALLFRHGFQEAGVPFVLNQGRYVGRPSEMTVEVQIDEARSNSNVSLSGYVTMVARGQFDHHVWKDRP